nr:hypothetical protein [uncultured Oscillibacter sp.]
MPTPRPPRRSGAGPARTAGASFQDRLERTSAAVTGPAIHLRMPGENTVYSGARGGRDAAQEICAEYTADSTPEDPVVRVTGTADSGPFDFTCHINDIDPSNASYAELAALYGHLVRTGACRGGLGGGVLPTGLESGDVTERRDYLGAIGRHQYDRHFGGVCRAQASELLALYQPYASGSSAALDRSALLREAPLAALNEARELLLQRSREGREWKEEQEEWDRLMKCLDSWIDALRERAQREREDRSGAVEGGDALLAMYRDLIAGAARTEAAGGAEDLVSALTEAQETLLERLKEDRAMEEERETWAALLRRLDRWIEALRDETGGERDGERAEAVSAAGGRTDEYNM